MSLPSSRFCFKPLCTGRLSTGGIITCPSRLPPVFRVCHSPYTAVCAHKSISKCLGSMSDREWKWEGDGREKRLSLPCLSPLYKGLSSKNGRKGGTFSRAAYFRITQGYFPITPAYPKDEPSEEFLWAVRNLSLSRSKNVSGRLAIRSELKGNQAEPDEPSGRGHSGTDPLCSWAFTLSFLLRLLEQRCPIEIFHVSGTRRDSWTLIHCQYVFGNRTKRNPCANIRNFHDFEVKKRKNLRNGSDFCLSEPIICMFFRKFAATLL